MRIISILLIVCSLLLITCEIPVGLEPVSGVDGKITFHGNWQDDIKAAAIIALDELDLENPAANLVTYSNLIDPGTNEAEYFIQLLPGQYYLAAVGITVDPGLFAVKIDSFLSAETIPIIIIDNDLRNLTTRINIKSQEITVVDREIVF
ncbi:MAG: hypothetical protein MUP82_03030 [Candidatus Marinimicrobia bacterium]|nr:hypothetical protein [Candidatus Neomarinimicrobiota bacterium]